MKIITEPAEPVTKFRKSVPPNVAAAVAKSLEKLPADRFESAKAFADALPNPSVHERIVVRPCERRLRRKPAACRIHAVARRVAHRGGRCRRMGVHCVAHGAVPVKRTRFTIVVSDSARIRAEMPGQNFAISPDGGAIAYRGGLATDSCTYAT